LLRWIDEGHGIDKIGVKLEGEQTGIAADIFAVKVVFFRRTPPVLS
jgi:hypothetical protein